MHVVATAGHVDHGKSTLVRALTGMEPDRWAEERRRGMTIDLGYAWTDLPSSRTVAFVDVPGHARFIGNMLAGLGPAPAVLFVVAADEGWRRQSHEHLAAITALGLRHAVLAVTRSDLADPGDALVQAQQALAASSLTAVEPVVVSGHTGAGLGELRAALDRLLDALPAPRAQEPLRLWIDRAFSVTGAGTVVTGTLTGGELRTGDELQLAGQRVRVRGLQALGRAVDQVTPVARVAVNLRGVDCDQVQRGQALLAPGQWPMTGRFDAAVDSWDTDRPGDLVLHVGTASVAATVRPLGPGAIRISLRQPLPLRAGDRALLRDPGGQRVLAGLTVLDTDPPELHRRGAAAARGAELSSGPPDLASVVRRRGALRASAVASAGVDVRPDPHVQAVAEWLVHVDTWAGWTQALLEAVDQATAADPLAGGQAEDATVRAVGLPDRRLLAPLVRAAGLEQVRGRVRRPGAGPVLGSWIEHVEAALVAAPFAAPDADELLALGASPAELAAAAAEGRLLVLAAGVVLRPDAPAHAMRLLAALPQPFTASAAKASLGTTRRVAIPLLEHLDSRGWTRRVDGSLREVVR